MLRIVAGFILVALICAVSAGFSRPASVEFFAGSQNYIGSYTHDFAARTKRPRVTIYPRRHYVGRNSVRQCRSWLVTEYRISGPVIVPRMRCWWE
jgi:hypothetical protein